jgi:glutamate-1-semialdehyde 2,1-aminomutase
VTFERSIVAFDRARKSIAGGVNSPVRAFRSVGLSPLFMRSGSGAIMTDLDGHEYIDYVLSWGPLVLGHAHPAVVKAIAMAAARGLSFGAPTEAETELAETIASMMPWIERLRLVSSGSEATMSAVRLARGFTRRPKIVKFAGCYHGHADAFLISAGSGALTNGVPTSPGVTEGTARDTVVLPFNDAGAVERAFAEYSDAIAAVIVEPYPANVGLILPRPGYLQSLRRLCSQYGALLIFDEVITGFRVGRGGAAGREGVTPDLTTLGKVIGGGLPVGAFGGRADVMAYLSPDGPVYQAGTLSGNPLATAAGLATLRIVRDDATLYDRLGVLSRLLVDGLGEIMNKYGVPYQACTAGSIFGLFFARDPVEDLEGALKSDVAFFAKYFAAMIDRGVYLAPSPFEAGFVSSAHTTRHVEQTLAAADVAVARALNQKPAARI